MRAKIWQAQLQFKGCIQGNQIVAPKDCTIRLHFFGNERQAQTTIEPKVQSDEKTVVEFDDQIIVSKRTIMRSDAPYYETFYLWKRLSGCDC